MLQKVFIYYIGEQEDYLVLYILNVNMLFSSDFFVVVVLFFTIDH